MPTRNKPEEVVRICGELMDSECRLWMYVANDDPKLSLYKGLKLPEFANIIFGEPLGFSRGVNYLAAVASKEPGATMFLRCEDDFYFSPGWDQKYREAMWEDGIGMVWCNYVLKGEDAEPHTAAIGAAWYHILGWFSLPGLQNYWCDWVLSTLAREVGRSRYIPEPVIEHRHVPSDPRKCGHDSTTYAADDLRYRQWWDQERERDCKALKIGLGTSR